ncbi:MAG: hypothetical protein RL584_1425 [Pseudomonadota bacterium]|jgi:nitroreductase
MTTVIDAIRQRTSANNFDPTHVMSREDITELVSLATESPSSFNMQNWRFIAVTSPEAKQRLKAAAFNQPKVGDAAVTFVVVGEVGGHQHLPRLIKPMLDAGAINQAAYDGWIGMANGLYEGKDQFQRDEAIRSASLASMTLMLAATGKGYVSGAMIGFDPAAVSAECGLAANEVPVMLIAVGRPAAGNWPRKVRRSIDEVLSLR